MGRLRLLTVLVATLVAGNVSAQTVTGSLSGTIVDDSNNVVPGADVTIVNQNTGEERRSVSNEVGDFNFAGLVPGRYTIRVALSGFKPFEQLNNNVGANSRLSVGALRLEIGAINETVSVTAQGETLDLDPDVARSSARRETGHQPVDSRPRPDFAPEGSSGCIGRGQRQPGERPGDVRRQFRDGGAHHRRVSGREPDDLRRRHQRR